MEQRTEYKSFRNEWDLRKTLLAALSLPLTIQLYRTDNEF